MTAPLRFIYFTVVTVICDIFQTMHEVTDFKELVKGCLEEPKCTLISDTRTAVIVFIPVSYL